MIIELLKERFKGRKNVIGGAGSLSSPLRIRQYGSGGYDAWGIPITHAAIGTEVTDYFYSSPTHHAGKSSSRRLRVNETAELIEDVELWISTTNSRRDFGGGFVTSSGTIIVFWVEHIMTGPDTWTMNGMGWYRSTDGFATFTTHTGFPTASEPDYANYGNLIEHTTTGRLYHMAYGTTGSGRGILCYSDDDGQTWTLKNTFGFISSDSEGALCFLGGTTNANAILGYFVRNDVSKLDFWRSSDGGDTFDFYEQVNWTSAYARPAMVSVRPDNGNIVLLYSDRDPYNYLIRAAEFDKNLLATGTEGVTLDARLSFRTISESFITSHPFESSNLPGNFGYPGLAWPSNADPMVFYYDQSPYQQQPWSSASDTVQCDTVIVPYESEVRMKARQAQSAINFPNGTTDINLEDTTIDNYGAWTNGNTFTAPRAGTYDVRINLPISSGNGGTKVLNVKKNGSTVYSITETDGNAGTVGKLQGGTSLALIQGDVLTFSITVSGATSTPVMNALTTPVGGLAYSIDITDAVALPSNIRVRVSSSSQSFTNSAPAQITGTETTDTDNAWASNMFTIPKTAWYKIRVQMRVPNAPGGRRVIEVFNYENGQESQETRRKRLLAIEDKDRGGTNTDTDVIFYYRLNRGEAVKFWFTVYGASLTSVAGAFNAIEIDEI